MSQHQSRTELAELCGCVRNAYFQWWVKYCPLALCTSQNMELIIALPGRGGALKPFNDLNKFQTGFPAYFQLDSVWCLCVCSIQLFKKHFSFR